MSAIAEAAAQLSARPGDLDAWWRLARALVAGGEARRGHRALAELGAAASRIGAVGLAVGCALELPAGGAARRRLVADIASRHAGGERAKKSGAPPAPPGASEAEPVAPEEQGAALELAAAAVRAAAAAARERAPEALPPRHLVASLAPGDLEALVDAASLVELGAGDRVIAQGSPATELYWIARGRARATRDGVTLGELSAGAVFGEIALLSGTTRTADVVGLEPTWLIEIPAAALEDLARSSPELAQVLARYARLRLLSNLMRTSPLFSRLGESERAELLAAFETRVAAPDETVIAGGEENDRLYVVVSGRLEVRRGRERVAELVSGTGFGERSLLSRQPADADVVATEPTVLLSLLRETFDAVADRHPGLLAEVYKLITLREKEEVVHDATDLVL